MFHDKRNKINLAIACEERKLWSSKVTRGKQNTYVCGKKGASYHASDEQLTDCTFLCVNPSYKLLSALIYIWPNSQKGARSGLSLTK